MMIEELRTEMQAELNAVRSEMAAQGDSLRAEMAARTATPRRYMDVLLEDMKDVVNVQRL
jgi:hypothetical protein